MNKKKKIIVICSVAAAAAAISVGVGVSLAYLAAYQNVDNTITVGHNTASIQESDWSEPDTLSMHNTLDKTVTIKNASDSVPCFVRVYAEFSDSDIASRALVSNDNRVSFRTWSQFKEDLTSTNTGNWRYIPDGASGEDSKITGYFYYIEALPSGGETSPLFTDIKINYVDDDDNTTSNIDLIHDTEMIIYSETVQVKEAGAIDSNGASVYGYNYDKPAGTDDEWKKAWKSFLKVST